MRGPGAPGAGDWQLVVLVVSDGGGAGVLEAGAGRGGAAALVTLGVPELALQLGGVDLLVLPETGGVGVGLVAAPDVAVVRLVRGVHVHVLLAVARVGESSVASFNLALKWLFTYRIKGKLINWKNRSDIEGKLTDEAIERVRSIDLSEREIRR